MKKKTYTVRLYSGHDLDLISLFATHDFYLPKALYCVLSAFEKKEHFMIEIPERKAMYNVSNARRIYTRRLKLDEEKDAAVIEMLSKVKSGCRNNFLKMLLRQYLAIPLSAPEVKTDLDYVYFQERFDVLRSGRRTAKAAAFSRTKRQVVVDSQSPKVGAKSVASQPQKDLNVNILELSSKKETIPIKNVDELDPTEVVETSIETQKHLTDSTEKVVATDNAGHKKKKDEERRAPASYSSDSLTSMFAGLI